MMVKLFVPLVVGMSLIAGGIGATRAEAESKPPRITSTVMPKGLGESSSWQTMQSRIDNPSDSPVDATIVVGIDEQSDVQFAAPVWVPAHGVRQVDIPVRMPEFSKQQMQINTTTLLLAKSNGAVDQQIAREPGLIAHNRLGLQMAFVEDPRDDANDEMLAGLFKSIGNHSPVARFFCSQLPTKAEGLAPFKSLIFINKQTRPNAAQREAIRRWTLMGGHATIVTTLVPNEDSAILFGDDWTVQPVSDVELHTADYQFAMTHMKATREPPAHLRRSLATGMTTVCSIDGWPVLLEKEIGLGRLNVLNVSLDGLQPDGYRGNAPAQIILSRMAPDRAVSDDAQDSIMGQQASSMVAYHVVSRSTILGILGGFVLILALVGIVLSARHRLEWTAPVAVILAIVVTGVLVFIGSQHQLPLTIASASTTMYVPAQHTLVSQAQVHVFSPTDIDSGIHSDAAAMMWPDLSTHSGTLARVVFDDVDRFHWDNLRLPAGALLSASVVSLQPIKSGPTAVATFTSDGLRVSMQAGELGQLSDVVLVTPGGRFAPPVAAGTDFTLSKQNLLPADSFFLDSLLTDAQRHHQAVYAGIFDKAAPSPFSLYAWVTMNDASSPIALQKPAQFHQEALMSLPITLNHTPAATDVHIDGAFNDFAILSGKDSLASIYVHETGKWLNNLTSDASAHCRFTLPSSVVPMQFKKATLHVSLRAPGRTVEILTPVPGKQPRPLDSRESPITPYDLTLTPEDVTLKPDGTLDLYLHVGTASDMSRVWEVSSITLDVDGTTLPVDAQKLSAVSF